MTLLLILIAVIFVSASFFGLMKALFRTLAVLCLVGAALFWFNGGREKVLEDLESGREVVLAQGSKLGGEERQLLEDAMRNPSELLGPQKARLREIAGKLLENPEIAANKPARMALEQLKTLKD